jgi:hypothetical protein
MQYLILVELRRKLMSFFETSDLFEGGVVLELMPDLPESGFLAKERALVMAKARRLREALGLCVDVLHDAEFALHVANKAFQWLNDRSVYHMLFMKL